MADRFDPLRHLIFPPEPSIVDRVAALDDPDKAKLVEHWEEMERLNQLRLKCAALKLVLTPLPLPVLTESTLDVMKYAEADARLMLRYYSRG